jgi:hypothetical protein
MSTTSTAQAQLTASQVNRSESAQWRDIIRRALADTRVSIPAYLAEDMDAATQTVTVQIAIQEKSRTLTGPQWTSIKPIYYVPILVPRGGGSSITLPLKQGDEGLLIFCDCCFDIWWQNGSGGGPVQQIGNHSHEEGDCGFFPGMWSQKNLLSNYSTDSLQVRMDDGSAIVDVSSGSVKVQNNGGTPLALMNDTFYQWYVAHIQPFLVSLGYSGPPVPAGSETTILKGQ